MAIKPIEILIKARDEASGIFGTLQGKVAAVGLAIASYFGVSSFIGAVKGAADLEAKLSEVKAVSGATAAEMVLLRKAAEEAGASTKFNATESADALGNLARAGLSAKDAIATLPAVLKLAQAGGIGLAEASEYVTKTVTGMGLAFSDAARVADVLAMGANASNTSVTGLAQALSYSAPVAKSLGLSLETTVAIIGKFADGGIDASRAGTALNAVLSQFSDPASRFRTELAAAGIITGNFEKALRQLAAAGPAGEKAILGVGTEAGPALRALLNQGIGALDDLKGKLDAAKGSAAATAAVMEDNLKGSFNSLSSAWDSVKNALATPVLPVLKDGVTQLAAAFSSAVSDGTIGKFGDAIATAFQGGIKWVKEFAAQVNFTELAARMQAFATSTQEAFTKIGEYATNAGNIVQTVYGVMSAGVNAVMTVVYGLGEAFAGVASNIQSGLALLLDGLAKITFGSVSASFKQAATEVRLSAQATWAASEAFAQKGQQAFNAMAEGAELARNGWAGLTEGTKNSATQAVASEQAFKTVAETMKEMGGDATAAGQKAQAAGILQKEAADKARAAVAQLKTEYEAALQAGNVQLAVEKLQAMQGALKATGDQGKLSAADIENAFTRLGVTSSAELAKVRDAAQRDYEIIKGAANSTAADAANAFKVYAAAAIAANNGVATEAIKVQAAMHGVEIQTDATGKAIVKSMEGGAKSIKTVEDAYKQLGLKTPEELNKIAAANKAAWDKISGDSSASVETLKKAFSTYAQSALDAAGDVGSEQRIVTEEVLKTEAALKGLTIEFDKNGKVIVKAQGDAQDAFGKTRDAVDDVTAALMRQNEAQEKVIAAQEKANALAERKKALEDKKNRVDSEGFQLNNKGERLAVSTQTERSIYENAKSQGLTPEQALQIAKEFFPTSNQRGGMVGRQNGENWGTDLQKAIDKLVLQNAAAAASESGAKVSTEGVQRTQREAAGKRPDGLEQEPNRNTIGASDRTVNINLSINNVPKGTVKTDPKGADVFGSFMETLQQSKLSSGL